MDTNGPRAGDYGIGDGAAQLGNARLAEGAGSGIAVADPGSSTKQPRRFYGSIRIEPRRLSTSAGTIAQEVVQHLAGLMDSNVEIVLEIQAYIPEGTPDHVVRTVTENCRTLGFQSAEFEEE